MAYEKTYDLLDLAIWMQSNREGVSLNDIAEKYQMPVIYSTHPRSQKFIEKRNFKFHPLVQSLKPFGFMDYNKLQKNAYCVLSDSGTLSEESAMLGSTSESSNTVTGTLNTSENI